MTTRIQAAIAPSDDAENHYGVCPHADHYKNLGFIMCATYK